MRALARTAAAVFLMSFLATGTRAQPDFGSVVTEASRALGAVAAADRIGPGVDTVGPFDDTTAGRGLTRSIASALSTVRPDARSQTRGPRDAQLYRVASPSVVLVVSESGIGSGALIGASGEIVTNWHVVGSAKEVGVIFKPEVEGQQVTRSDARRAVLLKVDEVADLALLRVVDMPPGARALEFGRMSDVPVGADVHAIGHPTGQSWTYTKGVVSQIRQDFKWSTEDRRSHQATVIQTQTPINPGNSGGPLLTDEGRIVGINSFKSQGEGLNFAVSVDDVQRFLSAPAGRVAATAPTPAARRATNACKQGEMNEVYSGRSRDGRELRAGYDMNCDGKAEFEVRIPDDPSKAIVLAIDEDGDGNAEILVYDFDRDRKWDLSLHDTNGDGRWDLVGHHPDGKPAASRFERYELFIARTNGGRRS
jgi:S1-C subfamily serine protease